MTSSRKEKTHFVVFLSNLKWQNLVRDSNVLLGTNLWKISHSRNPETEIEVQKFCSVLSGLVISALSDLSFQKYVSHLKEGMWQVRSLIQSRAREVFLRFLLQQNLYISDWKERRKGGLLPIPGVIPESEVISLTICAFPENDTWRGCWNMMFDKGSHET